MGQPIEALESPHAGRVTGLIVASLSLAVLGMFMGLFEGTVDRAVFFGAAALALGVVALVAARSIHAHIAGATVVLVVAVIAFASGLQSALLGTGQ
jgi:hypothetical protein